MVPALGRTALLATCAALAALGTAVADRFAWTVDSLYVLEGSSTILKCVDAGLLTRCDSPVWGRSFFPLAQYVPALALNPLGLGGQDGLHALVWINFACFVALLGTVWWVCAATAGRGPAAIATLALIASPLLFYADGAWGEMLAALLTVLFAATLLTGAPAWMIGLTLVCAGVTKDVALPLLLLLAGCALAPQWPQLGRGRRRALVLALGAASLVTVAINAGFNHYRFGGIINHVYGNAASTQIDAAYWPRHALAALVSPNAGIVEGWPIALLLIVGTGVAGYRRGSGRAERLAALAPLGLLATVLIAFSAYYSPFGWYAWLNRFCVPWVPAIVLVAVAAHPVAARSAFTWIARRTAVAAVVLIVTVVAAVSQVGALTAGQNHSFQWLFDSDATCPLRLAQLDTGSKTFRDCQLHIAWGRTPVVIKGVEAAARSAGLPVAVLIALACVALAAYGRRELLVSPESALRR